MPKELLHFHIAKQTAELLDGTAFQPLLEDNPEALLLGSVFHDIPFYLNGKPQEIAALGDVLHGHESEDTHTLLTLQAEVVRENPGTGMPAALLVGMITHIMTDVVFHPMVWHFTGDYHSADPKERSKARQRHRMFETILDEVACPELVGNKGYQLGSLGEAVTPQLWDALPITSLSGLCLVTPDELVSALHTGLEAFAKVQRLNTGRFIGFMINLLWNRMSDNAREIAALFHTQRTRRFAAEMEKTLTYRHPVTGEEFQSTIDEMVKQAAEKSAALSMQFAPCIEGGRPISPLQHGPGLDTGIPKTPPSAMHHFADPLFPDI